ncbi:MAG: hypothetical protein ACHQF3_00155 [Alphaproteobacteria bacterium]
MPTRRTLLSAAEALAVVSLPATEALPAPHPDARLLGLEAEWLRKETAANESGLTDEEREGRASAANDVMDEIADEPAQTLVGVAVKLRVASFAIYELEAHADTIEAQAIATALAAVTRIAAGGVS